MISCWPYVVFDWIVATTNVGDYYYAGITANHITQTDLHYYYD